MQNAKGKMQNGKCKTKSAISGQRPAGRFRIAEAGFRNIRCFTLIELLVVVAIIAVLVAILLPAMNRARAQAQQTSCSSQMRQYGQAIAMYGIDYDQIPFFHDYFGGEWRPQSFWCNVLNPYLGVPDDYPVDSGGHLDKQGMYPKMRKCPTGKAWIGVNYGGFYKGRQPPVAPFVYGGELIGGTVRRYLPVKMDRINDPSNWLALLDTDDQFVYSPVRWPFGVDWDGDGLADSYNDPHQIPYNRAEPKVHSNGCNVALCDGHVEWIKFETLWVSEAGYVFHKYWWNK